MKIIILTTTFTLLGLFSYSQAWMKGGNNPSGNPFVLGSNSNDPIFFETNGIQRLKVSTNFN